MIQRDLGVWIEKRLERSPFEITIRKSSQYIFTVWKSSLRLPWLACGHCPLHIPLDEISRFVLSYAFAPIFCTVGCRCIV